MKLSEAGEFGLIERIVREFGIEYPPSRHARTAGLLVGLGDDAVVTDRRDAAIIWTTDTMVAGEHFLPEYEDWTDTGWKSLASNVSDIAAMGGTPGVALVTLTLPGDFCVEDAVQLYRGLYECAGTYGITLGGGDIVRSPVFSITVALSGWAFIPRLGQPRVLRRSTARPGDVVAVSGQVGDSAGSVRLLLAGSNFQTPAEQHLRAVHARPRPHVALGQAAVRAGLRCGIDVSDGVVQDLGHIATASGVSIRVEAPKLPLSDALLSVFPADALELGLTGGEDYELILVGPQAAMQQLIEQSASGATTRLTVIGEVIESGTPGVSVFDADGRELELTRRGWDHFAT